MENQLARFELHQIEHVVDQAQQVTAAAENVTEELVLLEREGPHLAGLNELGEAEDCIERGPQLVRHVGEELALHPGRLEQAVVLRLGPLHLQPLVFLGGRQRLGQLVRPFLLGDVAPRTPIAAEGAVLDPDGHAADAEVLHLSVRAGVTALEIAERLAAGHGRLELVPGTRRRRSVGQLPEGLAERVLGRVTRLGLGRVGQADEVQARVLLPVPIRGQLG